MARQEGHTPMRGTVGNLTYRKIKDKYFVNPKSSLDKKRFNSDDAFTGSRESSGRFSIGQKIASDIYKKLYPQKGRYSLFVQMRSEAILLLKDKVEEKEIVKKLTRKHKPKPSQTSKM